MQGEEQNGMQQPPQCGVGEMEGRRQRQKAKQKDVAHDDRCQNVRNAKQLQIEK